MTKHIMVLLIAAFAGMFQALAEHVTKAAVNEGHVQQFAPSPSRSRELACPTNPDVTARPRNRALEKAGRKAVRHRDPQ